MVHVSLYVAWLWVYKLLFVNWFVTNGQCCFRTLCMFFFISQLLYRYIGVLNCVFRRLRFIQYFRCHCYFSRKEDLGRNMQTCTVQESHMHWDEFFKVPMYTYMTYGICLNWCKWGSRCLFFYFFGKVHAPGAIVTLSL